MSSGFIKEQQIVDDDYQIQATDFDFFALRGNTKNYTVTLPALADVPDGHVITIQHQNDQDFDQYIATATVDRKGNAVTDEIDNQTSPMHVTHKGQTIILRADTDANIWWPQIIYWSGNVG